MKCGLPLRHRTGVVMVTECTVWYPNARRSSHLKERLLAVLESHAPHWAHICGVFLPLFSPSQISPSWKMDYGNLSDYLYPEISKSFPLWVSSRFCHTSTDCGGKEHESRHKGWWQSITHTQYHRSSAADYGAQLFAARVQAGQNDQNSPL